MAKVAQLIQTPALTEQARQMISLKSRGRSQTGIRTG